MSRWITPTLSTVAAVLIALAVFMARDAYLGFRRYEAALFEPIAVIKLAVQPDGSVQGKVAELPAYPNSHGCKLVVLGAEAEDLAGGDVRARLLTADGSAEIAPESLGNIVVDDAIHLRSAVVTSAHSFGVNLRLANLPDRAGLPGEAEVFHLVCGCELLAVRIGAFIACVTGLVGALVAGATWNRHRFGRRSRPVVVEVPPK